MCVLIAATRCDVQCDLVSIGEPGVMLGGEIVVVVETVTVVD